MRLISAYLLTEAGFSSGERQPSVNGITRVSTSYLKGNHRYGKFLGHLILLHLSIAVAYSQSLSDTLRLPVVEILGVAVQAAPGTRITQVDSTLLRHYSQHNLGTILALTTPLAIKSYGQGGAATASFRGTSAYHTQVSWNGLNLNSPMLGQTDLSTIPAGMAGQLSIQHGSNSESGIFSLPGAQISLKSPYLLNQPAAWTLSIQAGSFGTWGSGTEVKWGKELMGSQLGIYTQFSRNDFTYVNNALSAGLRQTEKRQFAGWERHGVFHQLQWQAAPSLMIHLYSWWQRSWRALPPPLLVNLSERNESLGEWLGAHNLVLKARIAKWDLQTGTGIVYHETDFHQRIAGKRSLSMSRHLQQNLMVRREIHPDMTLVFMAEGSADYVNSPHYRDSEGRSQALLAARLDLRPWKWLRSGLMLTHISLEGENPAILPGLGLEIQPIAAWPLWIKTNAGFSTRYPSLNERYWVPGGNPGLRPETGRSQELGLLWKSSEGMLAEAELTAYQINVKDWIQWIPDGMTHFWTPLNLKKVNTRGLEAGMKARYQFGKHNIAAQTNAAFTHARDFSLDRTAGKYLVYIPDIQYNIHLSWSFRRWDAYFLLHHTGRRFTRIDGSAYMPSYTLSDIGIGVLARMKEPQVTATLNIQNLTDIPYQNIAWHPMPGRSIQLTLKTHFKSKKQ